MRPVHGAPPPHLANLANLVGGSWKVELPNGVSFFHTWNWGPGQFSLHNMQSDRETFGGHWSGVVLYWHPRHRQVCVFSVHDDIPGIGPGTGHGTMSLAENEARSSVTLHQPVGPRSMSSHWFFHGPDHYTDTLLEDEGSGAEPMTHWEFHRVAEGAAPRTRSRSEASRELPHHPPGWGPLLDQTWETNIHLAVPGLSKPPSADAPGESRAAHELRLETTLEWIPSLSVITARIMAQYPGAEATHILDAYIFHDPGKRSLRCLALSSNGAVYEGSVTHSEIGTLHLTLTGHEGDRTIPIDLRIEAPRDASVRSRIWSLAGDVPSLRLDLRHTLVSRAWRPNPAHRSQESDR